MDVGEYSWNPMIRNPNVNHPRIGSHETYNKTKNIKLGSSMVYIVTLKNSNMHYVTVGDNDFMMFSKNKLYYQSLS